MKKLLFAFMAMTLVACSGDDSSPVDEPVEENPENPEDCVFEGSVEFATQSQVADFVALNYCEISGSLTITGSVTDISGLQNIKSIGWGLFVNNTSDLISLHGLENAKIQRLEVEDNLRLKNLEGLSNVAGFIYNTILIKNNRDLLSLDGLISIESVKKLRLENNSNLVSIGNLELLKSIDQLFIVNNPLPVSLNGLRSLTDINSVLYISNTPVISLEGLENVSKIASLVLIDTDIQTLENLQSLNQLAYLNLKNNSSLISIEGLENITSIGVVDIENCPSLTSLAPLSGVVELFTYAVSFGGNAGLVNPRVISIQNTGVTSLNGLDNIDGFDFLKVVGNSELTNFCAIQHLFPVQYPITVTGNLFNPTIDDFAAGNCSQ